MIVGAGELPKFIGHYLEDYFDIIFGCDNWFAGGCAGTDVDQDESGLDEWGNAQTAEYIEKECEHRGIFWKDLRNKKILFLDIWERSLGLEGPNLNAVEVIYQLLSKHGISFKKVYFSNNDLNLCENSTKWIQWEKTWPNSPNTLSSMEWTIWKPKIDLSHYVDENFKGLDWTSFLYYHKTHENKILSDFNPNSNKKFMCLMGGGRPHRVRLWSLLNKSKIINDGHVSFMHEGISLDGVMFPQGVIAYDNSGLLPFFNDSLFSVIPENAFGTSSWFHHPTNTAEKVNIYDLKFISEKTWRVIATGHPFIIMGNKGILTYLKERGYHTFPELFDESYDGLEWSGEREMHIQHEILKLCSMEKSKLRDLCESVWWKVEHNRKLFYDEQSHKDYFLKDFYENI